MGVWEEEDTEAHFKDHNGETPVGNNSIPGEYFIYTFCLKDINYRQRVAHRQGWKCKTDKGCEWTTSTRHLILHTTDFIFTGCSCQVCSESERLQMGASIPACEY